MERRKFILDTTLAAALVTLPLGFYNCGNTKYDLPIYEPILLSNIWDVKTIVTVGQLYLKQHPKENTERKLVELLSMDISMNEADYPLSLTLKIEDDYKKGRTITIDGWILSTTEGRQCALFALIKSKN